MSLVDYKDFPCSEDTAAQSFVKMVKLNVRDIRNSFFEIGFRLNEAHNNAYYKDLGFSNIYDCAEALFDIKKSTCYNLMDIASRFASKEKAMQIDERYKYYSQSQLLCSLNDNDFYGFCPNPETGKEPSLNPKDYDVIKKRKQRQYRSIFRHQNESIKENDNK